MLKDEETKPSVSTATDNESTLSPSAVNETKTGIKFFYECQ